MKKNTLKRIKIANSAAIKETKDMVVPIIVGTGIGCGIRLATGQKEHLLRDALVVSGGLLTAHYIGGMIYEYHNTKELIVDEFNDEFENEEEEC